MGVTIIDYTTLVDVAYDAGLDEDAVRADYSGRGMYGDTCVGIVGSPGELTAYVAALAVTLETDGLDWSWIGSVSQDSMGLDMIWYWRGLTVDPETVP